jgi:hypothetical protein
MKIPIHLFKKMLSLGGLTEAWLGGLTEACKFLLPKSHLKSISSNYELYSRRFGNTSLSSGKL